MPEVPVTMSLLDFHVGITVRPTTETTDLGSSVTCPFGPRSSSTQYSLPHLVFQCSGNSFLKSTSTQMKSNHPMVPSHSTPSFVELIVTLILHKHVRPFNEVLSLLPTCLRSCGFLFTIISPFPHLSLTHSGHSINSELSNMIWINIIFMLIYQKYINNKYVIYVQIID